MRTIKLTAAVIIITLLSFSLAQQNLTFASAYAADDHQTTAIVEFARLVDEYTDGEITIEVIAGGVLGGERDVAEGIQFGTIDGAVLGGILQNFDPAMAILEFPFLFRDTEHVNNVMQGEVGQQIYERLAEQTGIRAVGYFMRTPRELTTLKPVRTLEDIKGMQVRVPEMPAHLETWKALGTNPTPLAFTEVYSALQQGVVDGQENPIGVIYANGFGEVVNYLSWTDHLVGFMLITVSDSLFQSLSSEHQDAFLRAAEGAREYNDEQLLELNASWIAGLEEQGVEFLDMDMEPWYEAVKDIPDLFTQYDGFSELYDAIVAVGGED